MGKVFCFRNSVGKFFDVSSGTVYQQFFILKVHVEYIYLLTCKGLHPWRLILIDCLLFLSGHSILKESCSLESRTLIQFV